MGGLGLARFVVAALAAAPIHTWSYYPNVEPLLHP